MPFYIISVILTLACLYFDKIFCCCCQCWNSAEEYVGVYDPQQSDLEFKIENGEVVEVIKEEISIFQANKDNEACIQDIIKEKGNMSGQIASKTIILFCR